MKPVGQDEVGVVHLTPETLPRGDYLRQTNKPQPSSFLSTAAAVSI